jgi:hypothetical protein
MPRHTGQLGLDARYTVASWATTFHAYLARTHHNLRNTYQVHVEDVNGVTLPAGVAGALARLVNPAGLRYSVVFPEGTRLVGLSFDTAAASATHVLGEFAYRPNQPIGMSPVDLLTASLLRAPTSLLAQRKGYLSVPAGGRFDGYDCFGVMTAVLGATQTQQNVAGAQRIVWSAELGAHRVRGLPDPAVMRYGRGLAFGSAPYLLGGALTPCVETPAGFAGVPGRTCTDDGYVSRSAWGLRGRAAATYAAPTLAALLTPSLLIAKDIHGYAHDGTFSEGRLTARLGLRADWAARWFADLAYVHFGGGRYNLLSDRSHVNMAAGLSF